MASFSFTITPTSGNDFLAPARGSNSFQGVFGVNPFQINIPVAGVQSYSYDDYIRITWANLQPNSAGVYNWALLDSTFNTAISRGQRVTIGIVPVDNFGPNGAYSVGGAFAGYPLYVHTAMQAESAKDWIASSSDTGGNAEWVPNWNSNSYLTAVENFLKAMAAHIATGSNAGKNYRDVLYAVDIRMFGNFGEWHTFGLGRGKEPQGTKATAASLQRIIDAHIAAFPNYPLIGNVNMFNTEVPDAIAAYVLTAKNTWGFIGWRTDHLGDHTVYTYDLNQMNKTVNGTDIKATALSRFKIAPITSEPMNNTSATTAGGSSNFWDIETETRAFGISQISNTNIITSSTQGDINVRNASKAAGYRINLISGTVTDSITAASTFALTLNWQNVGIAPSYENWTTTIELRKTSDNTLATSWTSSFTPKFFLPGAAKAVVDTLTLPGSVAAGDYKLNVIIKDPTGYRLPFPLAISGRNGDGSYTLTTINISGQASQLPVVNKFTVTNFSDTTNQITFNVINSTTTVIQRSTDGTTFTDYLPLTAAGAPAKGKYVNGTDFVINDAATIAIGALYGTVYYRLKINTNTFSSIKSVFRTTVPPTNPSYLVKASGTTTSISINTNALQIVRLRVFQATSNTPYYDQQVTLSIGINLIDVALKPGYSYVYINNRRFLVHR